MTPKSKADEICGKIDAPFPSVEFRRILIDKISAEFLTYESRLSEEVRKQEELEKELDHTRSCFKSAQETSNILSIERDKVLAQLELAVKALEEANRHHELVCYSVHHKNPCKIKKLVEEVLQSIQEGKK